MAETLVEKQVCASCGAEVRSGALFCYNCGGAISAASPDKIENNNGSGANGESAKRKNAARMQLKDKEIENAALTRISETKIGDDRQVDKPESQPEAKLKSAAAMRRKPKTFQKKEVEIVWEEQENPSSLVLTLTALLLTIFAAAVVILAMTLK